MYERNEHLKVEYKSKKLEKICTDASFTEKIYGIKMAEKIQLRVDQIKATDSIEMMIKYKIGRCHLLKGKRSNQYAVDLVHPYRLVFEKRKSEIHLVCII